MSPVRMARIEIGMRLLLAYKDAFNRHDVAGILALLSADCRFESADPAPLGTTITGQAALEEYLRNVFRNYPQAHLEIEEVFAPGLRGVLRWKLVWIPADDQAQTLRGVDVFQIKNERICEKLTYIKGSM